MTTIQGQATVSRPIIPQPIPLKVRDDVFPRDRIDTRENSVVRVLLGGKALVTVRELSIFTITEEPGRAIVDLQVGRLAVGVARKLLKPGESIEVRTPNAVAAIRGSFLVADVVIVGGTTQVVGGALQIVGGTPQTTFTALQVSVPITVSPRADPTITIPLGTNQTMGVSGVGPTTTLTPVQPATPQQVAQATQTGQAPKPQEHAATSPVANVVVTEQVAVAAQLAEILAPPPSQTSTTTTTEPPKTTTTDLCVQCGQVQTTTGPTGPQHVVPTGPYFLAEKSHLQLDTGTSLATFSTGTGPAVLSARDTISGLGTDTSPVTLGGSTTPAAPVVSATGANISIAGDLLTGGSHGPVINLKDSTLAGSSAALFDVANTRLTTSGLLAVDPSVLTLSGSLLSLSGATLTSDAPLVTGAGSTITATGAGIPLLDVQSSTLSVTGTGNSLLSLNASKLGVNGPFLAATGASTSIEVAGPLLSLAGGSTFGGKGPFLRMTGGSLTADSLAIGTDADNKFTLAGATSATDGLLLDLSGGAHLTLRTLLEAPDSNVVTFGPADTQPLVRIVGSGSSLNVTGTNPLFELAGGTLPPVVGAGSDLVTLSAGSLTSAGPLLSIVPGASVGIGGALALADGAQASFTDGTDVVRIPSGASLTTTRSLFSLTGGSHLETVGGGALIFQDPSLLILNNPALAASGSTVSLSGALLKVVDSSPLILIPTDSGLLVGGSGVLGTTSLATLDPSSLTFPTPGALLSADKSTVSFINGAPLLSLTDSQIGTPSTPGGGTLVDLKNGSVMTVLGPVLQMTNSTVNLAGALITGSGGSSFASVGPLVKMSGGLLKADALAKGASDNNTLTVSALPGSTGGLLLDLSRASATFRTLLETAGDDVAIFAPAAGQRLIKMGESNLTVTESAPLLSLEGPGIIDARALVATNTSGTTKTLGLAGPLLHLSGLTLSSLDPQISLSNMTLTQSGSQSLVRVSGSPVSVSGSLLSATESIVSTEASVVRIEGTTLTTGSPPLFTLTGGTFTTMGAASDLVTLAGGTLTLGGTLLSLSGIPTVSLGGDVLHVSSGVTGPSGGSLVSVGAGSLSVAGDFIDLGAGSTLTLSGPALTVSGGNVEVGNVLNLHAPLTTPSGQPFLQVTGGSLSTSGSLATLGADLTLGGSFLSQSSGSVTTGADALAVRSKTLTSGSSAVFSLSGGSLTTTGSSHLVSLAGGSLALGGALLSLTGSPTVSIGGDVLHVGSTLTGLASGSLISVGAGSLTADNLLAVETTLTLPGSLLTQTGGSVNVGSALALTAALTTTAGAPVLKVTDGELTATTLASLGAALILKDSFLTQSGGKVTTSEDALAVGAFTLDSTGTTKAVFDLSGGTLSAGGHVASVNGGILNLGGGLLNVTGTGLTSSTSLFTALDSTISAKGIGVPLARVESGTLNLTGAGNSLLSLDHSQLTLGVPNVSAGGPALESISSDITVAGALVHFQNGSSFTSTAGPLVKITSGSFSADALGTTDGLSNTIELTGTLVDLTNTTVTLRAVGDDPVGSTDTFTHSLASGEPAFRLTGSRLKLQGAGENLVSFGVDTGPVPDQSGVALIATGLATEAGIKRSRVEVAGTLLDLGGVHLTDSDPQIKLTNTDVVQTGSKSLIEVSGLPVTVDGSLLKATDSTISSEANLLLVQGTLTTGAFAAIDVNGGSVDVAGHLVSVNGGTLNLGGNLLSLTAGSGPPPTVNVGGDVLHVASSVTGPPTGSLFSFGGGTLSATGDLLDLGAGSTLTLSGPALTVSGGSVEVGNVLNLHAPLTTPSGQPLLQVTGGSLSTTGSLATLGANLTLGGAFLSQSGGTVAAGGPLVHLTGGSTFKNTVGPVVRMTGGSLTADALGISDSTGNTFDLTGTLLDLSNASVTLRTLGEEVLDNDKDTVKFNLALNQPLISMAWSTLALTGSDEPLVTLGTEGAPIPTQPGVALVATGTPTSKSTIGLKGSLLRLKAINSTATDPLIQTGNTTINQTGTADALISVNPHGLTSAMTGPLAALTDTSVSTSGPFFHLKNGTLTSATASPLISIDPSDAASGANFALLDGSSTLSLKGSFLSASSSDLSSGAGQSFIAVAGGSSLATMMKADPLIALSGGNVNAGAQFLHVTGPGSSLTLSGPLLVADTPTITASNNLVRIADGASVSSTSTEDLLSFTGGSFTGGGTFGTASGGSLLRMFSQTGQPGTSLTLAGRYLGSFGTMFISRDAPTFNIADGATLNAPGDFAIFGTGSATSAYSFFNLETNSSYMPPGQPTVVGSGAPASVTVGGTLIGGANFRFVTQHQGSFLNLRNGVSLVQTGKSALVALDGTGLGPSDFAVEASGNFLSLTAGTELTPPSLILGGSLLDVRNARLKNGDPASNAFTFIYIADGATVVGPTDPPALLAFDNASVDTSGNFFGLHRSATLTLTGPLFSATTNSTFNTTSLGSAPVCCNGFRLGQGAILTSTTDEALIQLTNSTFNSGLDAQSGGNFIRISSLGPSSGDPASPSTMSLAGPLVSATESTISALIDFLQVQQSSFTQVQQSSFTSTSPNALIQLTGSNVSLGGTFGGTTYTGRLLGVYSASSPFGSSALPSSLSLQGPALSATDSTLTILGDVVGVFGGASLASTTPDPFIQLDNSTLNLPGPSGFGFTNSVLFVGGTGSTAGTTPASVSLNGSLLTASNGSTLTVAGGFANIFSGGEVSVTGTTDPFVSITGGTHSLATNTGAGIFTIGSGANLSLSGGLLELSNATITTNGQMLQAPGTLLTSGPLLEARGGSITSTTPNAFMNIGPNTITSPKNVVGLYDDFRLSLSGSLLNATGVNFSATSNQFSFFAATDGASVATSGTNAPLLQFTGTASGPSKVTAARNFLPMAKTAPDKSAPSMNLSGPLLNAVKTDFKTGDPTTNTHTLLFIGDGAQLTSASASPLLSFDNSTVDTAGNILTLRRSQFTESATSPTSVTPSKLTLSGPLFSATNNSTFNTTSLGFGSAFSTSPAACCDGFFIGQGAQLTAATTSPLIQLTNSTFNAGPDPQSGGNLFGIRDTFTGAPAGELVAPTSVTLGNATVTAGPLLSATDSTISALFHLLNVTRSTFTSNSTAPLFRLIGTTDVPASVRTLTIGGTDPITPTTTSGSLLFMGSFTGGSNSPASISLKGPFLEATKYTINTTAGALSVFNGATLTSGDTDLPFVKFDNTSLTTGAGFGGDFLNVSGKGGAAETTASSASFKGPLLAAVNGSSLTLPRDVIIGANDALVTGTGTDAFVQLHHSQLAAKSLLELFGGATFNIGGDLLGLGADSTLTLSGSLVNIGGGNASAAGTLLNLHAPLTTPSGQALLNVTGGSLSATNSLATLGANLTLGGAFLSQSGGNVSAGSDALAVGSATLTSGSTAVFNLTGGSLTTGDDLVSVSGGSLALDGPLLSMATGSPTVSIGGDVLRVASSVTGPASGSLVSVGRGTLNVSGNLADLAAGSTLDLNGASMVNVSGPGSLSITGNLLNAQSATINTTSDLVNVSSGGQLTSASGNDLVALNGTALTAGKSDFDTHLVRVIGTGGDARSTLSLAGRLLTATDSSLTVRGDDFLEISNGGRLTVTGSATTPLIHLMNTSLTTVDSGCGGCPQAFLHLFGSGGGFTSSLSLENRPLLGVTDTGSPNPLTVKGDFLRINSGATLTSMSSEALIQLNGAALTAGTSGENTHFLHLSGVGSGPSLLSLSGGLLSATGGSLTVKGDDFLEIGGGAKLTSTGSAALVDLTNSSLATSGTGCLWGCPQSLLHLFGTSGGNLSTLSLDGSLLKTTNSNISVPGNSDLLTIASGAKLTTTAFAPILDVTGGTHSIGKSVLKLDAALLEASAPLLKLTNSASTMTVGQDFAKLTGNASFGPSGSSSLLPGDALVMLNASKLIVNGSLFNLSGSSSLNVKGDLLYLGGDSLLILNGGGILRLSGSASTTVSATISGALIRFGAGSNSTIRISNNFCNNSCTTYTTLTGDIRVATNGNSYTIDFPTDPSKLVKGTGTISYQSSSSAAILLSGKSTLTVQGNP